MTSRTPSVARGNHAAASLLPGVLEQMASCLVDYLRANAELRRGLAVGARDLQSSKVTQFHAATYPLRSI